MIPTAREEAVVRALAALLDGLPLPGRAPLSASGFVHGTVERESCPDCLANGFVSRRCETCRGRGFIETRRMIDPYDTGQAAGWFGSSAARHERSRARDREIAVLTEQVSPPRSEADLQAEANAGRGEGWELERRRAMGRPWMAELRGLLEVLAVVDTDAWRAVWAVHVYGWLPGVGAAGDLARRGVVWLAERLPEEVPGWLSVPGS